MGQPFTHNRDGAFLHLLEKGDEAASKFSEKKQQLNARVEGKAEAFDRIKVELPPFSPRFLQL